jgi:DNA-binding transcriptional ArsR family regulator
LINSINGIIIKYGTNNALIVTGKLIITILVLRRETMKDAMDLILNPIRTRIIQVLSTKEMITASELCEKINDIPRTTLYRHINILLENNILLVVAEKKIRGSLERTLALNTEAMSQINTMENAPQNVLGFLMNKYARFQNYWDGENADPVRDKLFLSNSVVMLNDQEFDQFLSEVWGLIQKYNYQFADGRKARDISIISLPIDSDKKID